MIVYLAGGMKSGWQDVVINSGVKAQWINPREHGLTQPEEYTRWDMDGIFVCDIVFAYLEENNPAGQNMMFEIGYAVGLSKHVIYADCKKEWDARTKMAQCAVDYYYTNLNNAIKKLDQLCKE